MDSNHSKKSKNLNQFHQTDPQRKISYAMILHFTTKQMRRYEWKNSENYRYALHVPAIFELGNRLFTISWVVGLERLNKTQNLGYGTKTPRALSSTRDYRHFSYFTPFYFLLFSPVRSLVPGYVSLFSL